MLVRVTTSWDSTVGNECVCCTAGGVHVSTQLEAVQSGYGAATRGGSEVELQSGKPEREGPAGTTQDKVSMLWSERWCSYVCDID